MEEQIEKYEIFFGMYSDGKEGGSDGKENSRDGYRGPIFIETAEGSKHDVDYHF